MKKIFLDLVQELYKKDSFTKESVLHLKRIYSKKHNLQIFPDRELVAAYKFLVKAKKIKPRKDLEHALKKAAVRTGSGVSIITVLTKPYSCPGNCIYCPSEKNMPKSYLSNEPAAQRALGLKFNAVDMVQQRIKALEINGHDVDKIELLVLGGSFTAYTKKYRQDFINKCFYAANTYGKGKRKIKSLEYEQKINEKTKYRIIGITLETRPDEINIDIIKEFRQLGCTRVQLGIQHTDAKILKLTRRGHGSKEAIEATYLLKQNGFKVDHHYMPDLPGSSPAKDLAMMKKVYSSPDYSPDQIKLYPCIVNEYADIYKWYKKGIYKPYTEKQLFNLLLKIKKITPYWVRINRLIRDIPTESIIAGNKITNLRQDLKKELEKQSGVCKCIRCREVGLKQNLKTIKSKLFVDKYKASKGTEYFISYESPKRDVLYGFLRLRVNDSNDDLSYGVLKDSAIVRELHVYGQLLAVGDKLKTASQHKGLGKRLLKEAESISKKLGINKICIISGVGVRIYYEKLDYQLEDTYLIKNI